MAELTEINTLAMEQEIRTMLQEQLPDYFAYHTIKHTEDVYQAAMNIASQESVNEQDLLLLKTAVFYHDVGYIIRADGHEAIGCEIATSTLGRFGYSPDDITAICGMIMATKIPQSPATKLEEIICDADLDYLGRDDYELLSGKLYQEFNARTPLTHEQWLRIQIEFLLNHHYFTNYSNRNRSQKKESHLQKLQAELASLSESNL